MDKECEKCLFLQADKLFQKYNIDEQVSNDITQRIRRFIISRKESLTTPEAACILHRMMKRATNSIDLYEKEKARYNKLMLSLEDEIRQKIHQSKHPFETAMRYALAGNIIDYGPPGGFDALKTLSDAACRVPAIDHSEILFEELQNADTVLYLGDNAGEIVLDKLFIETIKHPNLFFATRGGHIINDITLEDAEQTGITRIANVISNGYDAPSTILSRCSDEFLEIFDRADIVISKGQGNLEGLLDIKNKKIFFLLMVKCQVIADRIGVDEKNSVAFLNEKV
jgi:damage-control phosphatase, subfamily I